MRILNEFRKMVLRLSVVIAFFTPLFCISDEAFMDTMPKRLAFCISLTWLFVMYYANFIYEKEEF